MFPQPPAAQRKGPRPEIPPGLPITAYPDWQLVELLKWIESDELPRSEEHVFDEFMGELGFRRRGSRIRDAFERTLPVARHHR